MSRLAFAKSFGAQPHNVRGWSYISHDDRFVMFGAWVDQETVDRQLIFSENWKHRGSKRKSASYGPSLRHLEHVIEDGYSLYTFRQYSTEAIDGEPRKLKGFDSVREKRALAVVGKDYFALKVGVELEGASTIEPTLFTEGERFDVIQTHFERSQQARDACIHFHGAICKVCNMDFENRYGEIGRGFIHVHHIIPVSDRKTAYKLDAKTDLVPVCANCHAMLHKRKDPTPFSVDELKERMSDLPQ